ncbi:MAG: hypothetical protein Q4G46_06875, partial [Propionibacteriaceae bacterium]|nr:hypothetical protein [Propionibacteriaceae bacterium]
MLSLVGCGVKEDFSTVPDRWVEQPAVSEEARSAYNAHEIQSAYSAVTAFALKHGYPAPLMDPQRTFYAADELNASVVRQMTPALQERWRARVASALAGNAADQDGVRVLQFYKWDKPTWRLAGDSSPVTGQWIRNAEIGVSPAVDDNPQRMKITVIHEAELRYEENDQPFALTVVKRVSYWLVPNEGSPAWLIDEYEGIFQIGEDLPVEEANQESLPEPSTTPGQVPEPPKADDGVDLRALPIAPNRANAPPVNPVNRTQGS